MTIGARYRQAFVTGAAGFIGSTLVDRLLTEGIAVTGYDDMSSGQGEFMEIARRNPNYRFVQGDVLDRDLLAKSMQGADVVFHLAANADVRFGLEHPEKDLQQNTVATFNVLEAMRTNGVKQLAFSSTGSVYGETRVIPTPEDAPFPVQTSLYGASKVAGEALIAAYCEGYGIRACIFRFVSILGERYTHGHVFDFYKKLLADPTVLPVLGDGHQKKSYLYVQDCVDAMFVALERAGDKATIFNLGTNEYCEVNNSIGWIAAELGLSPRLAYSGGHKGWVGDNPFIFLDNARIRALGWKPKLTIREGIQRTLRWLVANQWVLNRR